MKTTHLMILILCGTTSICLAQNVSINENGTAPNPYAIRVVDAINNDKGILIPLQQAH